MSHFSQVETEFTNLEALKAAVKALGFELVENAEVRGWNGIKTRAQYVIKLPDGYDLGFNYNSATKTFTAVGDFYQDHIEKYMGKRLSKLKAEYVRQHIILTARRKGHMVLMANDHCVKVRTPDGATIVFSLDENGNYSTVVHGASGQNCLKLTEDYESGTVKRAFTTEYFERERGKTRIRVGDGSTFCG
jgi:hypothetical protein